MGLVVGIATVSILSLMLIPTTQVTAVDQRTIQDTIGIVQPGPSPDEMPIISENWQFHPRDGIPSTGKPQLKITELYAKPDKYNRINFHAAQWLQNIIDKPGKYVDLPEQSKAEYFGYYNSVRNTMAYFEVTFPNGTAKYYHIEFHEDPLA